MASITSYTKAKIDELISAVYQALGGKAPMTHRHTIGQIDELETTLNNKPNKGHTHEAKDVNGLVEFMENGVNQSHKHVSDDITDATSMVSSGYKGKVVKTSVNGQVFVRDDAITLNTSIVNKKYVDDKVGGGAPWVGTQSQYNQLTQKDSDRLYLIV